MAYKRMNLVEDSNMTDYFIGLIGYAVEDMEDVDLEISLETYNDTKVTIKVKISKSTRKFTWQDIATAISQKLMGITVLLAGQPAAIYSYNKNVVLR